MAARLRRTMSKVVMAKPPHARADGSIRPRDVDMRLADSGIGHSKRHVTRGTGETGGLRDGKGGGSA
jgi:hypothetical protein